MDLYVVRHAVAHKRDEDLWPDDAKRPLTPEGEERFPRFAGEILWFVTKQERRRSPLVGETRDIKPRPKEPLILPEELGYIPFLPVKLPQDRGQSGSLLCPLSTARRARVPVRRLRGGR